MAIRKPKITAGEARQRAGGPRPDAMPPKDEADTAPVLPATPERKPAAVPAKPVRTPGEVQGGTRVPGVVPGGGVARTGVPVRQAKQQIFLSAIVPRPGVSPSFDQLSGYYPPARALQMILRRAMSDFEIMLANGTYVRASISYQVPEDPDDCLLVQTSRAMPVELVDRVIGFFDPLGFESKRAIGLRIATAALATYFDRERKA